MLRQEEEKLENFSLEVQSLISERRENIFIPKRNKSFVYGKDCVVKTVN